MKKLRQDLAKLDKNHKKKRVYFLYRNKMNTTRTDFENMSEAEFRERYDVSDEQFAFLKDWENREEYKELLFRLKEIMLDTDLLEVYENVKAQAKKGENSAIVKTFLELQKVIKARNKPVVEDFEEEDDDDDLAMY